MVSNTISGKSYILGIQKASIQSDVYSIFFNIISNNVTNTNTSNGRLKWIFPAFPSDVDIEDSNTYPIIVVESPDQEWARLTQAKKTSKIDVLIVVYSTSKESLDDLSQDIIDAIETNWRVMHYIGLNRINLGKTSTEQVNRGKISVHLKLIPFTCEFNFRRT